MVVNEYPTFQQAHFTMMFRTVEVYLSNVVRWHDDVTRSTMDRLSGVGAVVQVIRLERLQLKIQLTLMT